MALGLAGIGVVVLVMLLGSSRYGWSLPFGGEAKVSAENVPPEYVMGSENPAFGPECGEYGIDVGGGGYGVNTNLKHHTKDSIAIVEGVARLAGPARFGRLLYSPDMDNFEQMSVASGIDTPFTIEVFKTHKGPEKAEWEVSVQGGLVDCVSYRLSADGVRVFGGATGLFFINSGAVDWQRYGVAMTIAVDGPEWFFFTERNLGSIEEALALIETFM